MNRQVCKPNIFFEKKMTIFIFFNLINDKK